LIKHKKFGKPLHFAGGIWTWNGHAPNFRYTYETVKPALEECLKEGVRSVFAAAWAYGDINHIQGLPCLAVYSEYCWRGLDCTKDDIDSVAEYVTGFSAELCDAISDFYCGEDGDRNTGKLVLWSDPLIHLLCYGFDFPAIEACYVKALEVFERYPNAPYIDFYKALFRCVLHKTRLHMTLREHYLKKDLAWLSKFRTETLPIIISDFEELYRIHDEKWHEESKTHGFEKLANMYAAAIERLRYTGKQLDRYLSGSIQEIEAFEQEALVGEYAKYVSVPRVMQTY